MKRINKFAILKIRMEGFKRFKELFEADMDFLTYVSGGNGQGKTTIADAIAYAFCGTPFWGEKSCDRLINPECKEMKVEIRFVDEDGEIHCLTRRKNGNTTTITLDTVQLRQTDIVNVFADKDIILSVLNPLFFIEKIAEDGREFLQKLLPSIDAKDVLSKLSDSTQTLLENEGIKEPEYYIKTKREELTELERCHSEFNGQLELLKNQKTEADGKIDAVIARGEKIVARKAQLEKKQFDGIDVEKIKAQISQIAAELSDDKRAGLLEKQAEIKNRTYESKFTGEIAKMKNYVNELSEICKKKAEHIKSIKVGDICPTCRTAVTKENYDSIINTLKAEYMEVRERGLKGADAYKELIAMDAKSREKFEEFRNDDLKKVEVELAALGTRDVSEIAMLQDRLKLGNLTEEEFTELSQLKAQAEAYANEVKVLGELDKYDEKVQEIEKHIAGNQRSIASVNSLIHAAGEFAAKKAEMTFAKLKMNRASIKLHDLVKTTGELKNVFRFTYDGKDYRWLSTSEKLKAGLEVSDMLKRLTGLCYPTYIDNAECLTTKLDKVNGQIILAKATNCELSVQCPRKQAQPVKEAA